MARLLFALLLGLTGPTAAFKFMSSWRVPRPSDILRIREAQQKFGDKKLAVITGTSSGLGRKTARALLQTGQYHVVGAVRDLDKMELVAELEGFPEDSFTAMQVECVTRSRPTHLWVVTLPPACWPVPLRLLTQRSMDRTRPPQTLA